MARALPAAAALLLFAANPAAADCDCTMCARNACPDCTFGPPWSNDTDCVRAPKATPSGTLFCGTTFNANVTIVCQYACFIEFYASDDQTGSAVKCAGEGFEFDYISGMMNISKDYASPSSCFSKALDSTGELKFIYNGVDGFNVTIPKWSASQIPMGQVDDSVTMCP